MIRSTATPACDLHRVVRPMFMISKEAIARVMSLKDKLSDTHKSAECIADVENMITAKESILARAEWGSCCGNICSLVHRLEGEIQMLHAILGLLREGDSRAAAVLDDYIALIQDGYTPEPDHW
ncbi:MAG: hypothetical protein ACNA7X_04635 [Dehalococcoidia bacterium]